MALSNIFREPRREITETVVGIAVVAVLLGADYFAARELQKIPGWSDCPLLVAMVLIPGAIAMGWGLGLFRLPQIAHAIGEDACEALQRHGIHLRPRNRVRR
jgi:H+/Cl- antiporter ClcA